MLHATERNYCYSGYYLYSVRISLLFCVVERLLWNRKLLVYYNKHCHLIVLCTLFTVPKRIRWIKDNNRKTFILRTRSHLHLVNTFLPLKISMYSMAKNPKMSIIERFHYNTLCSVVYVIVALSVVCSDDHMHMWLSVKTSSTGKLGWIAILIIQYAVCVCTFRDSPASVLVL